MARSTCRRCRPSPNWPIIDELEKQYDVVRVDPSKPITEKLDVLLAVQPSTLGPQEMKHFIAAVAGGLPTAIFEDPAPLSSNVAATSMPRQPPGGMNPMMRMQAPPKGDIRPLWNLLGVEFPPSEIVWQDFNPYPKVPYFSKMKELVFANAASGAKHPFNADDPISSGLQQILFPYPGFIEKQESPGLKDLKFTPLVRTNDRTGTVSYRDLIQTSPFGEPRMNPNPVLLPTDVSYTLAAHIEGKRKWTPPIEEPFQNPGEDEDKKDSTGTKPIEAKINVVLSTDLDMISPMFFALRDQGEIPELNVHFHFDNVTFVLNALDELAGDDRFIAIRKRRPGPSALGPHRRGNQRGEKRSRRRPRTLPERVRRSETVRGKGHPGENRRTEKPERRGHSTAAHSGGHDAAEPGAGARRQTRTDSIARKNRKTTPSKPSLKSTVRQRAIAVQVAGGAAAAAAAAVRRADRVRQPPRQRNAKAWRSRVCDRECLAGELARRVGRRRDAASKLAG